MTCNVQMALLVIPGLLAGERVREREINFKNNAIIYGIKF
jgi:hypothetical protein